MLIVHSYVPKALLVGTMFPLPKIKGFTTYSEKYRAITLSGCILKVLDLLILSEQRLCLETDVLQFGFKENCSTTLCTLAFQEICEYFNSEKSAVYSLLLDATKAFDRVNYAKLFRILIDRGMNSVFIRLLLRLYTSQTLRVNWQGFISAEFTVTNGVRQGGVLSPILFIVYLDALISKLRLSGLGCYVGPHFTGVLAYADDLVLLSPTKSGLKAMAKICDDFSNEYDITFNAAKSQYCVFRKSRRVQDSSIVFRNTSLPEQAFVSHLGHKLFCNPKCDNIDGVIASFYRQYNVFKSRFGCVPSSIQSELFSKHCSSFYGCLLLPFRKCLKRLQVVWRKALRKVWRLPSLTHCSILRCLSPGLCDLHMFVSRCIKAVVHIMNYGPEFLRFLCKLSLESKSSNLADNVSLCCQYLEQDLWQILSLTPECAASLVKTKCLTDCRKPTSKCAAEVMKELINCRDNLMDCGLTTYEICVILNDLSIN